MRIWSEIDLVTAAPHIINSAAGGLIPISHQFMQPQNSALNISNIFKIDYDTAKYPSNYKLECEII